MSESPISSKISEAISKARVDSCCRKVIVRDPDITGTDFSEIYFSFGEIDSVTMRNGKKLQRGMVVNVSSRYTGNGVAVIIGFNFGRTQLPITISKGGAEGELSACVSVREISFFPTQKGDGRAVILMVKDEKE